MELQYDSMPEAVAVPHDVSSMYVVFAMMAFVVEQPLLAGCGKDRSLTTACWSVCDGYRLKD